MRRLSRLLFLLASRDQRIFIDISVVTCDTSYVATNQFQAY